MNHKMYEISSAGLGLAILLVLPVVFLYLHWKLNYKFIIYAAMRMFAQLMLIGYFLVFIFKSENVLIVLLVLSVMILSSSWIALSSVKERRINLYISVLAAITIGGTLTLFFVTQLILQLNPWYEPAYMVPIAGMIYANAMNSVSLAAERYYAELSRGEAVIKAKRTSFQASLIPVVNSLFAVGLVSLPGMMTGQILSGVSPLIAARYQIVVMCMVLSSAGISSALFLLLASKYDPPLQA